MQHVIDATEMSFPQGYKRDAASASSSVDRNSMHQKQLETQGLSKAATVSPRRGSNANHDDHVDDKISDIPSTPRASSPQNTSFNFLLAYENEEEEEIMRALMTNDFDTACEVHSRMESRNR